MKEMNQIIKCRTLEGFVVELQFKDGFIGRLDLSDALSGPVFEPLRDAEVFRRVQVEDGTIRWPNDADFDPDVLRYWCESGGVQSQEQTDAWFMHQFNAAAKSA